MELRKSINSCKFENEFSNSKSMKTIKYSAFKIIEYGIVFSDNFKFKFIKLNKIFDSLIFFINLIILLSNFIRIGFSFEI